MKVYEDLIQDLGKEMGISLKSSSKQSCCLNIKEGQFDVYIDLDHTGEQILLGAYLGDVPPGSYRTQIFEAALKANGVATSPRGTLAFSEKKNKLVLFQTFPITHLNPQKLHAYLNLFLTHAKVWVASLESQIVPEIETEQSQPKSSGMLGMQ
ncbi:MAG: hypothetical protein S4CHLAM45_09730 [Chlamydiales bacterium]|nr:hypothetical protein [Chlamydiales bacterium]MCH9620209.1 hypothetical protein [Chlamydiales bacterium]MCH9623076.1 hypothetical protein [Chlamydiales bacterium]